MFGDDPASEHEDVVGTRLPQQLDDTGEQRHVSSGEEREPDRVGVLLDDRFGDLLGRLVKPRVDHLEAGVAQGA